MVGDESRRGIFHCNSDSLPDCADGDVGGGEKVQLVLGGTGWK